MPDPCTQARRWMAIFVERGLTVEEGESMRAHVRSCTECRIAYQSTIQSAARLGRSQRSERLDEVRERRARARRRVGVEAASTPRRGALRLVLVPALFALLVLQFHGLSRSASGIEVTWSQGEVYAAGRRLGAEEAALTVGRGVSCHTRADGRAELRRGDTELVMESETTLEIELDRPIPRLRFHRGTLRVTGPCAISTAVGVVEQVEGSSTLHWFGRTFELTCHAGSVALTDSEGHHELGPEERLVRNLHGSGLAAR